MTAPAPSPEAVRGEFLLDPAISYLNHGGFGACPAPVVAARRREAERIEADPTGFYRHRVDGALAEALAPVAGALGAAPGDLAWVPNATFGLNLVARSLADRLGPGDEVLLSDVEYGSQVMLWRWLCERTGARLRLAPVDGVARSGGSVADAVEGSVSAATRVALLSHVTSATAQRLPVEEIAGRLRSRGVVVVVDGAHVPGQVELDLASVGADYYVGNLHKWYAAPRGAAVLHAPGREAQGRLDPLVVSWGGTDRADPLARRVHSPGTVDPTGYLVAPEALAFHRQVLTPARPGARRRLAAASGALGDLGFARVGSHDEDLLMSAFELPVGVEPAALESALEEAGVEAVVTEAPGRRLLRICVAWYTTDEDVERLLDVVRAARRPGRLPVDAASLQDRAAQQATFVPE